MAFSWFPVKYTLVIKIMIVIIGRQQNADYMSDASPHWLYLAARHTIVCLDKYPSAQKFTDSQLSSGLSSCHRTRESSELCGDLTS